LDRSSAARLDIDEGPEADDRSKLTDRQQRPVGAHASDWQIAGTGDFDGSGKSDILWRDTNGTAAIWLMNCGTVTSSPGFGAPSTSWQIKATGDFNVDGKNDILWRFTDGMGWSVNGLSRALGAMHRSLPSSAMR
jgi:FG-GAP-like repeat